MDLDKVSRLKHQENSLKFYFRKAMKYRPVFVSKTFKETFSLSTIELTSQLHRMSGAAVEN